jgi:hypothetical protein
MSDRFARNWPYVTLSAFALIQAVIGWDTVAIVTGMLAISAVLLDISEHLRDLKKTGADQGKQKY